MHAGIRTPGAWDPFELTVRAILGQQISVKAATTIAGRIAQRWGSPIEGSAMRLFPAPTQLMNAPLEEAGIIATRANSLRAVATAMVNGSLAFDRDSAIDTLRAIPGIGEWTAQYIAMRALNQPDAFPSGDLVLRNMAGGCSARELDRRSESWRPWRAYAVMLLWQAARDLEGRNDRHTARRPRTLAHAERRLHPVSAAVGRPAIR
jgi:AraC family transcriptional regulator of adaptative response / DNA-3-methyladenine glycosylase II